MAASMISLPVMEASSTHAQSDKKRHKVSLDTQIFLKAIKAVQIQPAPSSLPDHRRKSDKPPKLEGGDGCNRATESKSESNVVLSRGSCSVDQVEKSRSDNLLEPVEISCSVESQPAEEKTESFCGPIVDRLLMKEGDCDVVDSHLEKVETGQDQSDSVLGNVKSVSEQLDDSYEPGKVQDNRLFKKDDSGVVDSHPEKGENVLDPMLDKIGNYFDQLDQDRCQLGQVKGQNDQPINSSVCEQPTVVDNTEPVSSVDQEHAERKNLHSSLSSTDNDRPVKCKDLRGKPKYVRGVRSANQEPLIEQRQMLNRGEVEQWNKDRRSSDRGKKEQRMRDCGKAEQQNKYYQSSDREKTKQNNKGYRSSDHVKKEEQTKDYRSSDREKIDQPSKDYRPSGHEKIEQPSKNYRSSDHGKIDQSSNRSSDHEKIEQLSKDYPSLDREKIDRSSNDYRSSGCEKIEQPSKDYQLSDCEKIDQLSEDYWSSGREKIEQPIKDCRSSGREKIDQPSKDYRSSGREKKEQPSKDCRSSDRGKIERPSKDCRSSDCEKIEQQSKDYRSSYRGKQEPQSRDCRSNRGQMVQRKGDGGINSFSRYPGSYKFREEQQQELQQHEFGDHRVREQRGRGKRRHEREQLYHYSKIPSDSGRRSNASQNVGYRHDDSEKPRKYIKERLMKSSFLQRKDEGFVASSDDVSEHKDHPETRIPFSASARGRKSRRGAGALGLDYDRQLGSRESVKNERSNEAEVQNSTSKRRGHGNSAQKPSFADSRCSPEHKSQKKLHESKTDKKSDYDRVDFPNKFHKAGPNPAEHSDVQSFMVFNRGCKGRAFRGGGWSTQRVEHFSSQSRRVTSHCDASRRNSSSVEEDWLDAIDAESQKSKACGRVVEVTPGKSVTTSIAPEKSVCVFTHSSKQDSCDNPVKDKDLCCIYNSRDRSKGDEKSKSRYDRPVIAGKGEEKLSMRVDGADCNSDRTKVPVEVSKRCDAVLNSDDTGSFLSSHFNMLQVNEMEFTNTLLRDSISSCANNGSDVDSLCSIFSALDTSSIAPSVISEAMDATLQQQIPEAPGASVTDIPLPTDGKDFLATPVLGCFQPQEVKNLNSQGFGTAERRSRELVHARNFQLPYHPQFEGSLERSSDSHNHDFFRQYSDGQLRMPYGVSLPSCCSPPSWNNQLALPPAGPPFRTPLNTGHPHFQPAMQQSVKPMQGMVSLISAHPPPASHPRASQRYGSGRFLHTPPAIAYQPPEPKSPAPDPRFLLQAAFQGWNNQPENHQATPLKYSSPYQTPLASPSTTPTANNWSLATTNQDSNCGYGDYTGDKPLNQPDSGTVVTPQEVPQLTPPLNISLKDYQHWMDCYIKARDTHDEAAISWCRHYWYVAVFLPSVQPQADVVNSPVVGGSDPQKSLNMGAGTDLSEIGVPLDSSEQQTSAQSDASAKCVRMSCSEWKPVGQEASADSAKSSISLGYSDQKSCDSSKNECRLNNTPHRTFSGISGKNWKDSKGAEERMKMKCKRLSYGNLDATDLTTETDVLQTKAVKKFKIERAVEQKSFRDSRNSLSFRMKSPRFQRSLENQSFRTQLKGKNTEGRSEESDHPKFQVIRRSFSSLSSEAVTSPENFIAPEWMDWKTQFKQMTESANLPYIDSHCHLDLLYRRANFQGTFKEFRNSHAGTFPPNFFGCVAIFCNPLTWSSYLLENSLFNSLLLEENIWAAVGCHPKSATDFSPRTEMNLRQLLRHERVKALGEVGLDYSGNYAQYRDVQIDVLQRQVTTAVKLNKPLVIHARDAENEIGEVLEKLVPKDYKIHRHCFLGSWSEAEAWLQKFPCSYIGLTPAVTHSKPHSVLRDLMWHLPLDKILLETDAPYFIPAQIPNSEMSLSHPGLAITVAIEVANVKHLPVNDILSACLRNTREMYDL